MLRIVTIVAAFMSLAAITVAAPTDAQARFGAEAIAQAAAAAASAQPAHYGGYRHHRPYYGGGYYHYRRYGYPASRDALDTCAYC